MSISYIAGILLTFWVLWDLFNGSVYLLSFDKPHYRHREPGLYWLGISLWSVLAASCFLFPSWSAG